MADDPDGPAADSSDPATAGGGSVADPVASDSGKDRRNVVYLVPTISSPAGADAGIDRDADLDSLGATAFTAQGGDLAHRQGHGAGDAAPGHAGVLEPDQDLPADHMQREDWAWVQEWRAGEEPTPWATGVALAAFSALIVGVAVWVLSAGLADRPVIAVLVNLLVAAGLTPAIWLSRGLPVLRWIAAGAAAGIITGWVSAILMLPLPSA